MAAESARAKAKRHREIADRYGRGADGEEATAQALAPLAAQGWVVLHDVAWPGRRLANIDHVAVGPPGVFVIDSKNWSGRVAVERGLLRQNGRVRTTAVMGADEAASAVADLLPELTRHEVRAVLAFTGALPTETVDDVLLCSTEELAAVLISAAPASLPLDPEQVQVLADQLRRSLVPATDPGRSTTAVSRAVRPSQASERRPRGSRTPARQGRSRRRAGLVRPLIALGLAMTLLLNPGALTAAGQLVSDLLVDHVAPTTEPVEEQTKPVKKRVPAKERQAREKRDG